MTGNNPFGDFLTNLAAEVGGLVVEAWARRAGEQIYGSAKEQAVRRCLDAGFVAFLHQAQGEAPTYDELLQTAETFFRRPDVVKEITRLLRGQPLDHDELLYLFEEAGYPHEGVFDFSAAMKDFEGIFLLRAVEEEALQDTIQTGQLLQQTTLLESQLGLLRQMLTALNTIQIENIVGIEERKFVVDDVVSGDKINGDKVEGNKYVYFGQVSAVSSPTQPDYWERHYLQSLIARCDRLDLTTLAAGEAITDSPTLTDVFTTINLDDVVRTADETIAEAVQLSRRGQKRLEQLRRRELIRVTAIEAVTEVPRLVILGQPGGGKSTLVNHVAAQMARRRLAKGVASGQVDETPLPVRIILRRFAEWLEAEERSGDAGDVWDYIQHLLKRWGCADSYEGLRRTLIAGDGIIFFDGLDEIRDAQSRQAAIKGAVTAFASSLPTCQVAITSRPYAYTEESGWRLPAKTFPVVNLAPFDDEQIRAFNRVWHLRVMGPLRDWDEEQCRQLADRLTETIVRQPHLRRLAETPLLLTLIAQVNSKGGTLPENRADLYQQAVNLLLVRWENRIVLDARPGADVQEDEVLWLGVPTGQLRDVLAQLAYNAHQQQGQSQPEDDSAAEIRHADLKSALVERFDSGQKAEQMMAYIQHRAGLLVVAQEEAVYTFPHRTFQEYLAARHLLNQPNWAGLLCNLVRADPNWWQEVFLLSAGIAISTLPDSIPQLLNKLLPFGPNENGQALTLEVAAWMTLAASALVETNFHYYVEQEVEAGEFTAVYRRVQAWLKTIMVADELLPAAGRATAGSLLAVLGDDRPGVGLDPETGLPNFLWGGEVPPGTYLIGDDASEREEGKSREVIIERPYRLARYPVTNAQFKAFLAAPDFVDAQWWADLPSDEQIFESPMFSDANQPRETVSWYQAIAFCRWLNDKLGSDLVEDEAIEIDLPTEAEWEVAARWPDNRLYPWGDDFDIKKANTSEVRLGRTSAVGIYPSGRNTALDLADLSGNVWEWCRNKYYDPADTAVDRSGSGRVLRGGSWGNIRIDTRAASRNAYQPYYRIGNVGFRVVVRRPPSHS